MTTTPPTNDGQWLDEIFKPAINSVEDFRSHHEPDDLYMALQDEFASAKAAILKMLELNTLRGYESAVKDMQKNISQREVVKQKHLTSLLGKRFDSLCNDVRSDPNLGNSSKGKKDNFLDGAEYMLTVIQSALKASEETI